MTRTLSIAIKENTYQELKQKVGYGKISSFVNRAVEKELKDLIKEREKEKREKRRGKEKEGKCERRKRANERKVFLMTWEKSAYDIIKCWPEL